MNSTHENQAICLLFYLVMVRYQVLDELLQEYRGNTAAEQNPAGNNLRYEHSMLLSIYTDCNNKKTIQSKNCIFENFVRIDQCYFFILVETNVEASK